MRKNLQNEELKKKNKTNDENTQFIQHEKSRKKNI